MPSTPTYTRFDPLQASTIVKIGHLPCPVHTLASQPVTTTASGSVSQSTNQPSSILASPHPIASPSTSQPIQSTHSMVTRSKNGIFKPKMYLVQKYPLSVQTGPTKPTSVTQALADPQWKAAIDAKF
ncbi:hypothetical protein PanWU01x14_134200 [Parasponia andersonii]|uniref:Mitochondrial protein n=1 Tax=Parasponia andersonii TaxID=3476 RepID=A0A2P5CPK8_PARAD|nr:hypothetical protein PanWU01x14_134200 [Parasponia andersonii]